MRLVPHDDLDLAYAVGAFVADRGGVVRVKLATGETAVIVRRIGLSCVCLHQVESAASLRVTFEPGSMSPLYAGAAGRVDGVLTCGSIL